VYNIHGIGTMAADNAPKILVALPVPSVSYTEELSALQISAEMQGRKTHSAQQTTERQLRSYTEPEN
jgi:hypothetical protein